MRLFLSYANEDRETAYRFYYDLKAAGIKIWMKDEDLLPGQDIDAVTKCAIGGCDYFLPLLSSSYQKKRGKTRKELNFALGILEEHSPTTPYILPIRIEDCDVDSIQLKDLKSVDAFSSYTDSLQQILRTVSADAEGMGGLEDGGESGIFCFELGHSIRDKNVMSNFYKHAIKEHARQSRMDISEDMVEIRAKKGDIWFHENGMWGVSPRTDPGERLAFSISRVISSFVFGVSKAFELARIFNIPEGVWANGYFVSGHLEKVGIGDEFHIYTGAARDACAILKDECSGRCDSAIYVGVAKPVDSVRDDEDFMVFSPKVDFDRLMADLKQLFGMGEKMVRSGGELLFNVTLDPTDKKRYLRFQSYPVKKKRTHSGKNVILFLSKIRFEMVETLGGFSCRPRYGLLNWDRAEHILSYSKDRYELHELLAICRGKFDFLKDVYPENSIVFHIPKAEGHPFSMRFEKIRRNEDLPNFPPSPQVNNIKRQTVDFATDKFCLLRTEIRGCTVIVQGLRIKDDYHLILMKTTMDPIDHFNSRESFFDSSGECVAFVFQ